MTTRQSTALLTALGVLAVSIFGYFAFIGDEQGVADPTIVPERVDQEAPAAQETRLPIAPASGEDGEALAPVTDSMDRIDVAEQDRAEEEARKQWISGRVKFGFDVPADEILYVLSLHREFTAEQLYGGAQIADAAWDPEVERKRFYDSARVEEDGTFRISVQEDWDVAHLALSGRYVFSKRSTSFSLPVEKDELVLTGVLGSWITGKLLAPKMDEAVEMSEAEVSLAPDITGSFDAMSIASEAYGIEGDADEQGRFEFRSVSSTLTRLLRVSHDSLASHLQLGLEAGPGEHVELEVRMREGATLRGRLENSAGEGLPDVEVSVELRGQLGAVVGELRTAMTGELGAFELEHVLTGRPLEINASPKGYLEGSLRIDEELFDGQVLANLLVVVEDGATVEGRVTYSDGLPAADARVIVSVDLSQTDLQMMGMRAGLDNYATAETDAKGRFIAAGLGDGPFLVRASIENEDGDHEGNWSARKSGIQPGDNTVVLELKALSSLKGILTTASELEIEAFKVSLVLEGSGGMMGIGSKRLSEEFDEPEADGGFVKDGIAPGVWAVTVKAEGFAFSESMSIEVPQPPGSEPPVFDLVPSASVAGTVVDSFNNPVLGAQISLELDLGQRLSGIYRGNDQPNAVTDHEGKYLLEGLNPGSISVVAKMTGFAASEPQALELVSGETTEDVDLTLRVGGILTGQVMDDEGEPAAGKMVVVQVLPNYNSQHVLTSGTEGEFRVEHLEPGQWQVVSMRSPMTGDFDPQSGDDMGDMLSDLKLAVVEITDGEETHVILGQPPEDAIEVSGTVVHDGEPVGGVMLNFLPEGSAGMGDLKMVMCKDDGSFSTTLDRRGPYLISIQSNIGTGRQNTVEVREVIPEEVATYNLTLTLPIGGISGRVLGVDGRPAGNCRISLNVDEGIVFGTLLGGHYTEMVTEEDGTYEINFLAPGKYRITAGGATLSGMLGDDAVAGRVVESGIVVAEGQMVRGVDFRLKSPGVLTGRVTGVDQQPVSNAAVFVRDSDGRVLDRISFVNTDTSGRFKYSGIAEGDYTVSATKGEFVSQPSDTVKLVAGGTAEVNVVLDEGTTLIVSVIDKSGNEIKARLSVQDSLGREMAGMHSMSGLMQQFNEEFSTMEQRVGPLPPGKYRVEAILDDGRSARKNITATGRAERKVKLRVK